MTYFNAKSRDEIAAAYSSPPWWYDIRGFFILTFAYNNTVGSQLRWFGRNFGTRHLEVACGTGTLLEVILYWRKFKRLPKVNIVGIDYAEPMLAGAINRFKHNNLVELHHADVAEMPFEDNSFDTANIANSVHCFPDVNSALNGVFRVLKPNGTLAANILLYPRTIFPFNVIAKRINKWGIKKGILYTPYELDEIKNKFINSGFLVESELVSGNCYNILVKKPASMNHHQPFHS